MIDAEAHAYILLVYAYLSPNFFSSKHEFR